MDLKGNTMAKSETTEPTVTAAREILPIKSTAVVVDVRNFLTKDVVVHMDDALTPQDLSDSPKLWRTVQQSRDKALNALDRVTFVWHDKIASAVEPRRAIQSTIEKMKRLLVASGANLGQFGYSYNRFG
jgi:hypothetical protein